jgi:hypothetical protein
VVSCWRPLAGNGLSPGRCPRRAGLPSPVGSSAA